jgi:hypothetical protein
MTASVGCESSIAGGRGRLSPTAWCHRLGRIHTHSLLGAFVSEVTLCQCSKTANVVGLSWKTLTTNERGLACQVKGWNLVIMKNTRDPVRADWKCQCILEAQEINVACAGELGIRDAQSSQPGLCCGSAFARIRTAESLLRQR